LSGRKGQRATPGVDNQEDLESEGRADGIPKQEPVALAHEAQTDRDECRAPGKRAEHGGDRGGVGAHQGIGGLCARQRGA